MCLMAIGVNLLGYITSSIAGILSVRNAASARVAAKKQVCAIARCCPLLQMPTACGMCQVHCRAMRSLVLVLQRVKCAV